MATPTWAPRERLRDLLSVRARNVPCLDPEKVDHTAVYFALWTHHGTSEGQGSRELSCTYVSEQVAGTHCPAWRATDLTTLPQALSSSYGSGLLHLHLYIVSIKDPSAATNTHQPDLAQLPKHPVPEAAPAEASAAQQHDADGRPPSFTSSVWRSLKRPDSSSTPQQPSPEGEPPPADPAAHACCSAVALPGELVAAVSFDLACLRPLAGSWAQLASLRCPYPAATLLFELPAGIFTLPGLIPESASSAGAGAAGLAATSAAQPAAGEGALASVLRVLRWRGQPAGKPAESAADQKLPATPPGVALLGAHATTGEVVRALLPKDQLSGDFSPVPSSPVAGILEAYEGPKAAQQGREETLDAQELLDSAAQLVQLQDDVARLEERRLQAQRTLQQAVQRRQEDSVRRQELLSRLQQAARQKREAEDCRRRAQALQGRGSRVRRVLAMQGQALLDALQCLQAANGRLGKAQAVLELEGRGKHLKAAHAQAVARRCRMVATLGAIFSIGPLAVTESKPLAGHELWDLMELAWEGCAKPQAAPVRPRSPPAAPLPASAAVEEASTEQPRIPHGSWLGLDGTDCGSSASTTSTAARSEDARQTMVLGIGGLTIDPRLVRGMKEDLGEEPSSERMRKACCALGYAAHATCLLGAILGVPLRYPLMLGLSKSSVLDRATSMGKIGRELDAEGARAIVLLSRTASRLEEADSAVVAPTSFPLFFEALADRTRFAYAVFLLNKDLEQLLNAHGLSSAGSGQVVQNLYKLVLAAASGIPASVAEPAH